MNNTVAIWRKNKKLHQELGIVGEIVVFTKIYIAPEGFEKQVPYAVAIIAFDGGVRKTLQLVDYDEETLKVGQKVVTVVRRIGTVGPEDVLSYGVKARPI